MSEKNTLVSKGPLYPSCCQSRDHSHSNRISNQPDHFIFHIISVYISISISISIYLSRKCGTETLKHFDMTKASKNSSGLKGIAIVVLL